MLAKRNTSLLEGSATITRKAQQITADKIVLIRDPTTFKLISANLIGAIHLREPNTLILAENGSYDFITHQTALNRILYRTELNESHAKNTAWGAAKTASQAQPKIYHLTEASFSTCSPKQTTWHIKGSDIVLNKETGRGHVQHMRLYVKDTPIFYFPYVDFSVDHQRKTGFLWPTVNLVNSSSGQSIYLPFYWNLAPNYDTTITPGFLSKRGTELSDYFRYLTETHAGNFTINVLPDDRQFKIQQAQYLNLYGNSTDPTIQAELNRLESASDTRRSFMWQDETLFNEHWSSHINYRYAGDDYYLQDFSTNLEDLTQNQLTQEGDLYYKSEYWNFTGRLQTYQTLHPIIEGEPAVQNQYRRFPQLLLNSNNFTGNNGLEYFLGSEVTHFDIRNTPGTSANLPIGNRMNLQPGITFPFYRPYFYVNPRLQFALTNYQLYQTADTDTPHAKQRNLPIFDVASGLAFDRNMSFFDRAYQQTLEPQLYYTYIPYRNQSSIPVFDTTVNTLTYDQIFNYNRFSGLDRIGDANQVGMGLTMRLIESQSGLEKVRFGMGEILYFANRRVTLCNTTICTDNPTNHSNYQRLSPLSGVLDYHVNPVAQFTANSIWDPVSKQIDNTTFGLHYQPDDTHILNMGFSYVWNGAIQSGSVVNSTKNNLKLTDVSFVYPLTRDVSWIGRWSEDWNFGHLQNLLSGVQYDTCCWALLAVGGRAFTQLQNSTPQYQNEFYIQFALKGLGNIGAGNPSDSLNSINGYNMQVG